MVVLVVAAEVIIEPRHSVIRKQFKILTLFDKNVYTI